MTASPQSRPGGVPIEVDVETEALTDCLEALRRLGDVNAKARVVQYLQDRFPFVGEEYEVTDGGNMRIKAVGPYSRGPGGAPGGIG